MAFGPNIEGLYLWRDDDSNLEFAQGTSISGQFAQKWKLRKTARGAAPKEIANSKLRRLPARNQSFGCADVSVGGFRFSS